MAIVYQFPCKTRRLDIRDLFSNEEVEQYYTYFINSDDWQRDVKSRTLYEGYPAMKPCNPIRDDMVWYVNEEAGFGTWIINKSALSIQENEERVWGWSPFVRKSTAPIHEPLNLTQKEMRHHLAWIVDEEGYGQYGLVTNTGEQWVPHPRPSGWRDHNAALGN
ncbi:hypothetical protein [Cohnella sp. AR92]|uniref:hypothetical protein n=1 Tax=Cohnella sp. AR92 TaxID=648716 RepID=UPI000F8F254D|nr:hypothetical protein [Cohnella sp. AR92]RUS44906.1 hypothetical protein ELR57_21860 [Cohnella sp. AR92]